MTTFDLLMNLVWLWLAGCFGLWVWIISKWLRFEIKDRRDQRDSELQSTKVFPCRRETAGLDTQLREPPRYPEWPRLPESSTLDRD